MLLYISVLAYAVNLQLAQASSQLDVDRELQLTVGNLISATPEISEFSSIVQAVGLDAFLKDGDGEFTILAPSNEAIEGNELIQLYMKGMSSDPPRWSQHLLVFVNNHILEEQLLFNDIFNLQRSEVASRHETLSVSQFSFLVGGATLVTNNVAAVNGVIHIIDAVIPPTFFDQTFANLELQPEFGPDIPEKRVSMVDVVDNVNGRETLRTVRNNGLTYAGCRIRAFNRMGLDYLPQTINGGQFVKENELMNASFAEESLKNFVEYQLIPENIYLSEMPNNYQERVTPISQCGQMWITYRRGKLCFNDGCLVVTQGEPRTFLAANGVGYVLDRCPICPGIAMLTDIAHEFTTHNTGNVAQLFVGTEWNLRNLSINVGNGEPVTLFAPIDTGFDFFTLTDTTRISTDKWRRHLWNLCKHFMAQGIYSESRLKLMYFENNAPFNITMLTGENVLFDYDQEKNQIIVGGGALFLADMRGVDGIAHFISDVPEPRSITKNCFTIVEDDPGQQFSLQLRYLTSVFLEEDVKTLLPLTVFYAPDDEFDGKIVELLELEAVLKNHIFKELLWCERLLEWARFDVPIVSQNGVSWTLVEQDGYPCIETLRDEEAGTVELACVTQCDILASNGIVHIVDKVILVEALETIAPFPPVAPTAPTPTFSRPQDPSPELNSGPVGSTSGCLYRDIRFVFGTIMFVTTVLSV